MPTDSEQPGVIPKRPAELAGFDWPPEPKHKSKKKIDGGTSPTMSAFASLIDSIEEDLLGRTMLAFDIWAARTGWAPQSRDAYCWRCAGSIGPHEQDGEGCAACRTKSLPWDRAMRLGPHRDELRDEVLALKFSAWRPGARALGRMLGQRIHAEIERAQIPHSSVRLVPIPMHPIRRISRGIDHTQSIARWASQTSGCPIARVLRARYRAEQVGLSASARARNMKGAFVRDRRRLSRLHGSASEEIRVWILIDDVRTTGATFVSASRELRRGLRELGLKRRDQQIWVSSIAVASERHRRQTA